MSNQELLIALKEHLDNSLNVLYPDVKPTDSGTCFVMSKVAVKILRRLGYNCVEQRVFVILGNEKGKVVYLEQEKTGQFNIDEIIKDGGWTIGLGGKDEESNHYIVIFPNEKEIMDITFGQAKRTEKNIPASAYWSNQDNLPETIMRIIFIQKNKEWELKRDWYIPKFKPIFKKVIEEGYKKLKRFSIK